MTTTTHELDTDRRNMLSRLVDLNARVSDLNIEIESLKAQLRDLDPGDYEIDGRPVLRIIPTRRFDAAAAALTLPEDVRSKCLIVSYDAAEVKKHLTPIEVEEHMVVSGKPKVVVP